MRRKMTVSGADLSARILGQISQAVSMGNRQRMPLSSPPPRQRADLNMSRLRSSLSNGTQLVDGIDHRLGWARRLKDLLGDHIADLGGDDVISHSERMLVNRASMMALQLEMLEQKFAKNDGAGSNEDLQIYQRLTNSLRRTLQVLGLRRRPRDVTPANPLDYASVHAAE
jgi:hypothetical protein